MWPLKTRKGLAVKFHGVRIEIDTEMPIIKPVIIDLLRQHQQLSLTATKEGRLSSDHIARDIAHRQQQAAMFRDADAATQYSASKAEIARTASYLAAKAENFAKLVPAAFVGDGDEANAIDLCFAAAVTLAQQGNGEKSYQVKALIQIAIECAEAEAQAAKAMLARQSSPEISLPELPSLEVEKEGVPISEAPDRFAKFRGSQTDAPFNVFEFLEYLDEVEPGWTKGYPLNLEITDKTKAAKIASFLQGQAIWIRSAVEKGDQNIVRFEGDTVPDVESGFLIAASRAFKRGRIVEDLTGDPKDSEKFISLCADFMEAEARHIYTSYLRPPTNDTRDPDA